jgi:hypothetical protein
MLSSLLESHALRLAGKEETKRFKTANGKCFFIVQQVNMLINGIKMNLLTGFILISLNLTIT